MKNIFILFFILFSFNTFSQKSICEEDSTNICLPVEIGKKILIDLNDLDRLRQDSVLCNDQIKQLELKVEKKEYIIQTQYEKEKNLNEVIKSKDEKFRLVDEENNRLRDDIGKLKTKNTVIEIVAAGIIGGLIYIFAVK
jgi:hypothetical protein